MTALPETNWRQLRRAEIDWRPLSEVEPYHGYYVWLLCSFPTGDKPVLGIYRKGVFFGKEVEGWWSREKIAENGRPTHGMWIEDWLKGWAPYSALNEEDAIDA